MLLMHSVCIWRWRNDVDRRPIVKCWKTHHINRETGRSHTQQVYIVRMWLVYTFCILYFTRTTHDALLCEAETGLEGNKCKYTKRIMRLCHTVVLSNHTIALPQYLTPPLIVQMKILPRIYSDPIRVAFRLGMNATHP